MIYLINFLLAFSTSVGMTVIPLIVTDSIGLSLIVIGILEGGSEFLSNVLKLFSGNIFDKIKDTKKIFGICTFFAFLAKAALLFCGGIFVFLSKIFERISNGMFAAPRDAYTAKFAKNQGNALSILICSKTLGCILGAFAVSLTAYFYSIASHLQEIIFCACCVNFIAFVCSFFIKNQNFESNQSVFDLHLIKETFNKIFSILVITFLFFLSRFNDGMLILYLKNLGFSEIYYTSTIGIFNFAMFVFAGIFAKLINLKKTNLGFNIIIYSMLLFNVIYLFLEQKYAISAFIGLILWGVQRCGASLLFAYMVFSAVEKRMYGTAIGIYSLVIGFASFVASMIFGYLAAIDYIYAFSYNIIILLMCVSFKWQIGKIN